MATTMEVGRKLADLLRSGKSLEALDTLFSKDVVSVEASESPAFPREMKGLAAVRGKNEWWYANHDVHKGQVQGPFPHGDRFALFLDYDVTAKAGPMAGKRMQMSEVALYTVQDGRIAREEFFYSME
jgi:ketosteroid isomerase-like protein